jgi:hypothetical protein
MAACWHKKNYDISIFSATSSQCTEPFILVVRILNEVLDAKGGHGTN